MEEPEAGKHPDGRAESDRPEWDDYFLDIVGLVANAPPVSDAVSAPPWSATGGSSQPGTTAPPRGSVIVWRSAASESRRTSPPASAMSSAAASTPNRNAIIQAALHGVSVNGATLYCTNHPCIICAKMIINAGIVRIVVGGDSTTVSPKRCWRKPSIEVNRP